MAELTVVTGAAGLIGGAVTRALIDAGRPVRATDRRPGEIDGVPVLACDLRDPDQVREALRGATAVVHGGGYSGAMVGLDRPQEMVDVNVCGTARVLEQARQAGVRRLVYLSSASAYGRTGDAVVTEEHPLHPASLYGATKAASEDLVEGYRATWALDAVSLRLSWVYGPRRTTSCVVRDLLTAALTGTAHHLDHGADLPRQYMYVDDAARAVLALLDAPVPHPRPAYNASAGERHTLGQVAALVTEAFPGARLEVAPGPDPFDVPQGLLDIGALAADTGFTPQVPLERGLPLYADWLADRLAPSTTTTTTTRR